MVYFVVDYDVIVAVCVYDVVGKRNHATPFGQARQSIAEMFQVRLGATAKIAWVIAENNDWVPPFLEKDFCPFLEIQESSVDRMKLQAADIPRRQQAERPLEG